MLSNVPRSLILGLAVAIAPTATWADELSTRAAIGGGLGGALGAFVGAELGGRSGAILGSGLGGAAATAIATDGYDRPPPRYYKRGCPRGYYWKKGRCRAYDWDD